MSHYHHHLIIILVLVSPNEQEDAIFGFLSLSDLTQHDDLQLQKKIILKTKYSDSMFWLKPTTFFWQNIQISAILCISK
jgi:hypothetical protein